MTVRITIPGNPGDGAVNAARRAYVTTSRKSGRTIAKTKKSKSAQTYEQRARVACMRATGDRESVRGAPTVRVTIHAFWPRQRHLSGTEDLALGDVDAVIKAALDALEKSRIIDDDARVIEVVARKSIDRENPRVEVDVKPWP